MSMSSRQCRGGGGSSSGASVSLISSPHTLHRYLTLTLRSSPAGGGAGIGVMKLLSRPIPLFHRIKPRRQTGQHPHDRRQRRHHPQATREVRPGLGGARIVRGDPTETFGWVDSALADLVEHCPDASEFVGRGDAEAQWIRCRDGDTGLTRTSVQGVEVLAGKGAASRPHNVSRRRPSGRTDVRSAWTWPCPGTDPGVAALVARAAPRFSTGLGWQWPDRAFVFESVTVLIGALAAGVAAVQTGTTGATNNGEFVSAPRAGPVGRARLGGDRHVIRCTPPV